MQRVGGKDASKQFWKYHNEGVLKKYGEELKVGVLEGTEDAVTSSDSSGASSGTSSSDSSRASSVSSSASSSDSRKKDDPSAVVNGIGAERTNERPAELADKSVVKPIVEPGVVAPDPGPAAVEEADPSEMYGEMIPFADPPWYQGVRISHLLTISLNLELQR